MRKLRIIDLFCGIGGVALGFHKFLTENNIDYEYVAVDNNINVLNVHSLLNPKSKIVYGDVWLIDDNELSQYDFIWASPPCETHSFQQLWHKVRPKPDMRLWELIRRLRKLDIPFVVENVRPYYGFILNPTAKADRHYLWSNLPLRSVSIENKPFNYTKAHNSKKLLIQYHKLPKWVSKVATRDMLRDIVNPELSYKIASQVIPLVLKRKEKGRWVSCFCFCFP